MGGTFVITLREGFEAALVLGLIYTYLEKIGARREFRYVTGGALLGVVASILLGILVTVLSGPLVGPKTRRHDPARRGAEQAPGDRRPC